MLMVFVGLELFERLFLIRGVMIAVPYLFLSIKSGIFRSSVQAMDFQNFLLASACSGLDVEPLDHRKVVPVFKHGEDLELIRSQDLGCISGVCGTEMFVLTVYGNEQAEFVHLAPSFPAC